jgi:hypothetical protein
MKLKNFFGISLMILFFIGMIILFFSVMGFRFANEGNCGGFLETLNYKQIYLWRGLGVIGILIPLIIAIIYIGRLSKTAEEKRKD